MPGLLRDALAGVGAFLTIPGAIVPVAGLVYVAWRKLTGRELYT
jgi:hypothetical protein